MTSTDTENKKSSNILLHIFDFLILAFCIIVTLPFKLSARKDFFPVFLKDISLYMNKPSLTTVSSVVMHLTNLLQIGLVLGWVFYQTKKPEIVWFLAKLLFFGYSAQIMLYDLSKSMVPELRPDAFGNCNVEVAALMRINQTARKHVLLTEVPCNQTSKSFNKTFFSGHASGTVYSSTFLILEFLTSSAEFRKVRSLLALFSGLLAFFVSFSRIFDKRHHFSDVCTGMVVGCMGGCFVFWFYKKSVVTSNK